MTLSANTLAVIRAFQALRESATLATFPPSLMPGGQPMTGDELKAIREALNLTQQEMAQALGVSRRTYWKMESTDGSLERREWLAVIGLWTVSGKSLQQLGLGG